MAVSIGKSFITTTGLVLDIDASHPDNFLLTQVEVLVVAGGGGSGGRHAGGGGGGGVVYTTEYKLNGNVSVTVGDGGAGSAKGGQGSPGQNSVFGDITAIGGGGGGGYNNGAATVNGTTGGSGGGAAAATGLPGGNGVAGSGTPGQGFPGGETPVFTDFAGGGGGGAGGPGGIPSQYIGGRGGDGLAFNISGTLKYYGGGGGASGGNNDDVNGGHGGRGGGGRGNGAYDPSQGTPGIDGTGGGGGGSRDQAGRSGGKGIVIVRYKGPQKATGGDTIESLDGHTVHTFTNSGTFSPQTVSTNQSTFYGLVDTVGNVVAKKSGTPTYSTNNGGYVSFNGTSDYLNLSTTLHEYIDVTKPATWETWAYVNTSNNNESFIGSAWGSGGVLFRKTGTSHAPANRIRFLYFTSGSTGTGFDSTATIPSTGWYHIVATYNGLGLTYGNFGYYLNGSVQSTTDPTFGSPTYVPTSGNSRVFSIGRAGQENQAYFSGRIAIVRLYDRVLTSYEISNNFNVNRGRFGI